MSTSTMGMLVKVCGITSVEDGRYALRAGATWIGLNLVEGPRYIAIAEARSILAGLDDPSKVVLLVALREGRLAQPVLAIMHDYRVHRLQVYGDVTPQAVRTLRQHAFETILPRPVAGDDSLAAIADFLTDCGDYPPDYLMLDASAPGKLGGTGTRANWEAIARGRARGLMERWPTTILAGGLDPENVARAISLLSPGGVDVCSGVEAEPGRKDRVKVRDFMAAVRRRHNAADTC